MHELSTPRLHLRAWRPEDRAPFAALNADPEVMRHFPAPLTREESDGFVDRAAAQMAERGWGLWALEPRSGPLAGRFVGYVGLQPVPFEAHFVPAVEIGWRLARDAWGHGLATEGALAAVAFGFAAPPAGLGLEEIVSFTAVANERSRAVMRRIGMTHDPADDFDHVRLPQGHRLRRHVLYRLPMSERPAGSAPSCRSSGA